MIAANDLTIETDEDTPVAIELTGSDVDGDDLTFTWTEPAHGTFVDGVYTPDANYSGADSFTYTADDGNGGVSTATIMRAPAIAQPWIAFSPTPPQPNITATEPASTLAVLTAAP